MKEKLFTLYGSLFVAFIVGFTLYNAYILPQRVKITQYERTANELNERVDSLRNSVRRLKEARHGDVEWTARAVLSETKRPLEMLYVATVIRNRVENGWRGHTSYKGVVLDPYQFSAFNTRTPYEHLSFDEAKVLAWQISDYVLTRRQSELPLSKGVTHFYSPRSMRGRPMWASKMSEQNVHTVKNSRFRFYRSN